MIKFYYHPSPNPAKVALFLEEAGLAYELVPSTPARASSTSRRSWRSTPTARRRRSSTATPPCSTATRSCSTSPRRPASSCRANTPKVRGEFLSWLMFVATGIGPYSGQAVHFQHFAPEPKDYAVNRYLHEARRHWGILDAHLAGRRYMVGDSYTIVDMAVWGWARAIPFVLGEEAWGRMPNLKRLFDEISARPAAERANALKDRHAFKTEMDEEARRHMFPQNASLAAA